MKSFLFTLLAAGLLALVLRPLLSTGGEPPSSRAGIEIAPLPAAVPKPAKPRRKPGRSIEQILNNPLDQ